MTKKAARKQKRLRVKVKNVNEDPTFKTTSNAQGTPTAEANQETPQSATQAEAVPELEAPSSLVKELQEELEQTKAQAGEYLEGWQRARAEFANYKRRTEAERAELTVTAGAEALKRVLPAIDDFERAAQTLPEDLKDNAWVNGVMLVHRKLFSALEAAGVKPLVVNPGDVFNPNLHEAITHEDSEQFASGQIIGEVQRGYKMGERVLRPAMVRVAK